MKIGIKIIHLSLLKNKQKIQINLIFIIKFKFREKFEYFLIT